MVALLLTVGFWVHRAARQNAVRAEAGGHEVRVTLLSAAPDGTSGNGLSDQAVLSADGNWVAFHTSADDIGPRAEQPDQRVLTVERTTGRVVDAHTVWDGESSDPAPGPSVSYGPGVGSAASPGVPPVAYRSVWRDPFTGDDRHGLMVSRNGRVEQVDIGLEGPVDGGSGKPSLDGRAEWLVFEGPASTLVPWDENQTTDVFARHLSSAATYLVSATAEGVSGAGASWSAHLSSRGGYVAFESIADDLVEGDANGQRDVFVQDLDSGWTERVSEPLYPEDGGSTHVWDAQYASVAEDGSRVVFMAQQVAMPGEAPHGVGVYLWEDSGDGGDVRLLSEPAGGGTWRDIARQPVISADGGWAAFTSSSRALDETKTDDETDIFLVDLDPGAASEGIRRVSLPDLHGRTGLGLELTRYGLARGALYGVISTGSALVAADDNGTSDVYLVEWPTPGRAFLPSAGRGS